jgi:hypothetical protein
VTLIPRRSHSALRNPQSPSWSCQRKGRNETISARAWRRYLFASGQSSRPAWSNRAYRQSADDSERQAQKSGDRALDARFGGLLRADLTWAAAGAFCFFVGIVLTTFPARVAGMFS